jgi:hypothetical protein
VAAFDTFGHNILLSDVCAMTPSLMVAWAWVRRLLFLSDVSRMRSASLLRVKLC